MLPSEPTNTIDQFIVYVHQNGAHYFHLHFMYIIPMYLRLTTVTKTLPQMSFHIYSLLFLFRSGAPPMTLLTAGALTDPQLPVTASNVCTTDARMGGVGQVAPHKQKSWLRWCWQWWTFYCIVTYIRTCVQQCNS